MSPTSYLFDCRNGRYQLFLGGYSTLAGIALLPSTATASIIRFHTDSTDAIIRLGGTLGVPELEKKVQSIPPHISLYDFACSMDGVIEYSTHDDCECHFDSESLNQISAIFERIANKLNANSWQLLVENPGKYIVFGEDESFVAYPDFDSLLDGENAG